MQSRKGYDLPLAVQVPARGEDRPSWVRVGVIAAIGFVVGVGWPRLLGIRPGPAAPSEATPAVSSVPLRAAEPGLAAGPVASSPPLATTPPAKLEPPPTSVAVTHGIVLSCRTEDGESRKGTAGCGSVPGFDPIAKPRLAKLAGCDAATGASGKLSAVFTLDFKTNRIGVDVGKSSTVANTDGLGACLKTAFQGVSLGPIEHAQPKYAIVYSVTFPPPNSTASTSVTSTASSTTTSPDDGAAQVIWDIALVRDAPRTGQVVARLQRGTKLRLGAGDDGWYRVQYGSGFGSEGWVYRGAIGK